jgi:DNA-binding response OmpR family regulator
MATSLEPKILIVDDDQALAQLMVMLLSMEGFRAQAAFSGAQALAAIAAEVPAAMLLDVMMPDMDGFTLLRRLRAEPPTADLPVVMLSARVDSESREESLAAGADGYLTKPADPQQLVGMLRDQLGRRSAGSG